MNVKAHLFILQSNSDLNIKNAKKLEQPLDHPYGYIKEGKVYLKSFLHFPERQIGEVKESVESTIEYFENRFEAIQAKVADLEKNIEEAENKGSFLMKLVHMKEQLGSTDALGDFTPLYERLEILEQELEALIAQNRARNQEIKSSLLQELQDALTNRDWQQATDDIKDIKSRWIKTGAVGPDKKEEIEDKFEELVDDFFTRKREYFERINEEKNRKTAFYQDLINAAKDLFNDSPQEDSLIKLKSLQQEWKKGPSVPVALYKQLQKVFTNVNTKTFNKIKGRSNQNRKPRTNSVRTFSAAPRMNPEEAQTMRLELAAKAEALLGQIGKETEDKARALQQEWRKTGKVMGQESYDLMNRFNLAIDRVLELNFLESLAEVKIPNYKTLGAKEKATEKISLLVKLLTRDKSDLANLQENMLKVRGEGSFKKTLKSKLNIQRRKVKVKEEILSELRRFA
ncbi:MAG: DUF349 domain-containing protein [Cyclobacteriaceae bacterium]|nr:DUF349 domain-containing protein [Cyclobacteriaceae bacterium]MCH8515868.1 DUF349 domain-containing protein [Cyclobacteriaceae bacterium]